MGAVAIQRFGTAESGFAIDTDAKADLRFDIWGFWDSTLADSFVRTSMEVCRSLRPERVIVDITRLKPQRESGQIALRTLMSATRTLAGARVIAVFGDNALTKMQLMRIGKEVGGCDWNFVVSEPRTA